MAKSSIGTAPKPPKTYQDGLKEGRAAVESKYEGTIVLRERHYAIALAVGGYIFVALVTFGSLAGSYEKGRCVNIKDNPYDCQHFDPLAGAFLPFIGGALWPIYWPLDIARAAFI